MSLHAWCYRRRLARVERRLVELLVERFALDWATARALLVLCVWSYPLACAFATVGAATNRCPLAIAKERL